MELFHCLATHSFVLVRVTTMLKILDDVFSGEIEVGNYLYWLSKLSDILCKSYTILLDVFPDMQINSRQLCSFPFLIFFFCFSEHLIQNLEFGLT